MDDGHAAPEPVGGKHLVHILDEQPLGLRDEEVGEQGLRKTQVQPSAWTRQNRLHAGQVFAEQDAELGTVDLGARTIATAGAGLAPAEGGGSSP